MFMGFCKNDMTTCVSLREGHQMVSKRRVMKHFLLQDSIVTHISSSEGMSSEQVPCAETFFSLVKTR